MKEQQKKFVDAILGHPVIWMTEKQYYCDECNVWHRFNSKIGKKHIENLKITIPVLEEGA